MEKRRFSRFEESQPAAGPLPFALVPHIGQNHIPGFALCAPLPFQKKHSIGVSDVFSRLDVPALGDGMTPIRRACDLAEIADGGLIYEEVRIAISPFATKFFIAEHGFESSPLQNGSQRRAILYGGLDLLTRFVPP